MNKAREQPIIIVRKKVYAHGHHGGAWKVAFADFMTAMMALFLVLWLITQSSDVKAAIAGYFATPLGVASEFGSSVMPGVGAQSLTPQPVTRAALLDLRREQLSQVAQDIRTQIDSTPDLAALAGHIEITMTDEGLHIEMVEDTTGVFFGSASAAPSAAGVEVLKLLGQKLGHVGNKIVIEGYTDAAPFHRIDGYSNWELSADRANAVRRILTDSGLEPSQVSQVRGYADQKLKIPSQPLSPSNRRVSITMLFPSRPAADSTAPDTTARPQADTAHATTPPRPS
jgi:chemotaxis protein MotB